MPASSHSPFDGALPLTRAELDAEFGRRRATDGRRPAVHGVWVPEHLPRTAALDLEALTAARPHAVATGWTAAALHGHPWLPREPELEVATGDLRIRRPGIVSRQFTIPSSQVEEFLGPTGRPIRAATFGRALFDLARYLPRDEAVAALDGAGRLGVDARRVVPYYADLNPLVSRRRIALGHAALCEPLTESRPESHLRMLLRDLGITGFRVQLKLPHLRARLDLGDPDRKMAIDYDGEHHGYSTQHGKDSGRRNRLLAGGWLNVVVTKLQLYGDRDDLGRTLLRIVDARDRELGRR